MDIFHSWGVVWQDTETYIVLGKQFLKASSTRMVTFRIEKQTNQTDIKWFGGGRKTDDPQAPPPTPRGTHTGFLHRRSVVTCPAFFSAPSAPTGRKCWLEVMDYSHSRTLRSSFGRVPHHKYSLHFDEVPSILPRGRTCSSAEPPTLDRRRLRLVKERMTTSSVARQLTSSASSPRSEDLPVHQWASIGRPPWGTRPWGTK